jgi:O-acetylserine/cysteine efflux transporter
VVSRICSGGRRRSVRSSLGHRSRRFASRTSRWCQSAASSISASGIAALAYVVVVSTFFGYGTWYWLLSRHPASTVAPFTLLVPVVGILTAWLVRSEHPTWGELLGSLIVLVGLALALGVVDTLAGQRRAAARAAPPIS